MSAIGTRVASWGVRLGVILGCVLLAPPGGAEPFPHDVLAAAELEQLRGGFSLGGLQVELGANVRTFADERLVLETVVNITEAGLHTQTAALGQGVAPVSPAALARLNLQGLAGSSGVTFEGAGGATTAVHQVTRERILGVLLTEAHDQSLRHELDVNVSVRNFSQFQEAVRGALLSNRLGRAAP